MTLDGTDLSGEYLLVEAMNIPLVGPNVPLAPGADCSDDLLDLVLVTERERSALQEYLRARLGGAAAPLELPVRRGRRVDAPGLALRAARGRRRVAAGAPRRGNRSGPRRGRGEHRAG